MSNNLKCPWCGNLESFIEDTRSKEGGKAVRRKRRCSKCGKTYFGREEVDMEPKSKLCKVTQP
jgi:transcriptional repressor NrdR